MYHDQVLKVPKNEDDFWKKAREQFEYARTILWETPVETKADALSGTYRKPGRGSPMDVIRYRDTSTGYDNRKHYLDLGASLLPYIEQALDEKEMTLEFVHQWAKFMFCHGYLASYYFEDSDDLAPQRAGAVRTRDAHRKWLAHLFLRCRDQGLTRTQSEERIVALIKNIILEFQSDAKRAAAMYAPGDRAWFEAMITRGDLAATYDAKHFSFKAMKALADLKVAIPPHSIEIP